MEHFSLSAFIAVVWVGGSQFIFLLLKKERNIRVYYSIFSLAFISYVFYSIAYENIFPMIFHFIEMFKEGSSYQLGVGGIRTASEPVKIIIFISIDLMSKILLSLDFFKLHKSRKKADSSLIETLNYVLVFTALSFSISLLLIIIFLIWVFNVIRIVN
ncbi:hypothetical protein KKB40_00160 [Patescibacteria group bacterium]|nr:hypothetical protein [Patescibacteria group bacterium]